ncbi:hypothetical protein Vretimale_8844 [Volvox reticuliferus]|uniref:Uncharacterized protein n=1 Tax=Volvox reticuliferus TaxID=1737510 RepID=A0A8J4C6R7_9CHLO|nr:hypothetical protein Vretifemale_6143 [Volvox reticuliferus]GIM04267.1 hypothetical protein Vretimale_8844 [Volvox reticuliferus]
MAAAGGVQMIDAGEGRGLGKGGNAHIWTGPGPRPIVTVGIGTTRYCMVRHLIRKRVCKGLVVLQSLLMEPEIKEAPVEGAAHLPESIQPPTVNHQPATPQSGARIPTMTI